MSDEIVVKTFPTTVTAVARARRPVISRRRRTILSAMAKLVYSTITSLDGYIADDAGDIQWGAPDAQVAAFINDLERGFETVLYGRRMYETMVFWEMFDGSPDSDPEETDFAEKWRSQTKIVFSTTLQHVSSARTSIERAFVPEEIRRLKESSRSDLSIGGAHLASQAIEARLVDEMHLYITPLTLGGGASAYPGEQRTNLELIDVNRFDSGVVHLHYRFN
jgi:dihydrofolate reductase